jgi:hypothetical protein
MQHVLDSHEFKYTFIAGLNLDSMMRVDSSKNPWETTWVEPGSETTCTVTMAETIPGTLVVHAWQKSQYLRDSIIIVPPAETLRLPFYADEMTPCDTNITKTIVDGASIEGCVLKKVNGEWKLWKVAGGGRFYAPGPADAPQIVVFSLKNQDGRIDSVFLRPDTTHYGIQRFYSFENQLLTYKVGDWVTVTTPYTNPNPQVQAFDYLYLNGKRYELRDTLRFAGLDTGVYRLSLEHIPVEVLWDVDGNYNATTWGVPIRIQQ